MLLVYPDFQLLSSYDILLWPRNVVFPVVVSLCRFVFRKASDRAGIAGLRGDCSAVTTFQCKWKDAYFVTSLSLMILFNSSATAGETNTADQYTSRLRRVRLSSARARTYSLYGSTSHFGNSSCWHNGYVLFMSRYPGFDASPPCPTSQDVPCEYSNSRNSWPCIP